MASIKLLTRSFCCSLLSILVPPISVMFIAPIAHCRVTDNPNLPTSDLMGTNVAPFCVDLYLVLGHIMLYSQVLCLTVMQYLLAVVN